MFDYKPVPSGLAISQRVVDCLDTMAPVGYLPGERTKAIRAVNEILQGRSSRTAEELLAVLGQYGDEQFTPVQQDIQDFLTQKNLLGSVYDKASNKEYKFRSYSRPNGRSLKIIDQSLYDRAAKNGSPPDFFRESYFDKVTFYCLANYADFYDSELHNCKFAVCRMKGTAFIGARIYDSDFYTSVLNLADFFCATLAHTQFRDCELTHVTFNSARMKSCSTIDCTMDGINYSGAVLDGCSFGRVTAGAIHDLDGAVITQGGATEEECRRNRDAIYQALGVKQVAA